MYFLILSTKLMLLKLSHCESAMSKLKNSTAHLMDPGATVRGILCAQVPILLLYYVVIASLCLYLVQNTTTPQILST